MSARTRNPLRIGGANLHSGNPDTGQQAFTQGGGQRWGFNSGGLLSPGSGSPSPSTGTVVKAADQVLIYSGTGRLDTVYPHTVISGVAIVFYDSAVVARSGPNTHIESGYGVLAVIPANTIGAFGPALGGGPLPIVFGTPFYSGLCVSATSGTPGCTVTFTPEGVTPNPGV